MAFSSLGLRCRCYCIDLSFYITYKKVRIKTTSNGTGVSNRPIYKDRFKLNKSFREYERDYARSGKRDFWSKPSNVVALILYGGSFLLIAIYVIVQLVSLFIEWLINLF